MPEPIRFFYDIVCPYAYLASTQIDRLRSETGAEVVYQPMLLGGVFQALGVSAPTMPPPKARHNLLDMHRWAEHFDVPLTMPPTHPRRTVQAMRVLVAAENDRAHATDLLFHAYWATGEDIADPQVLRRVLTAGGLDGDALVAQSTEESTKTALRTRTDEAVALGVFGAPSFVVGDLLFWGQDRLQFVIDAVKGAEYVAA